MEIFTRSVTSGGSRRRGLRRSAATATLLLAASATLLSACTGSSTGGKPAAESSHSVSSSSTPAASPSTSASSSVDASPAVITASPVSGAVKINPIKPVSVQVASGTLTSVVMTNPTGKVVTGAMSADGTSWHTTEVLGYSKTYTVVAKAVNAAGVVATKTSKFTTLTPNNMTMPYMDRIGGYSLDNGATYGVAVVPMIHFDEQIPDEAAAERALKVTSTPAVVGSWYWIDNQDVAYRPEFYWPSGTKVTVAANVYGVNVGNGLYGQDDESSSFTIGRKQLTVAYDNAPKVDKVYVYNAAGKVLRTMDTSMGQHGGEQVGNQYINFYTDAGTYTVLDHENPAHMSSASYGLPANDPHGYNTVLVPYSTKISIDGTYLHEYNNTIYDQEHGIDVSEGCLNLKTSDAVWFFDHSIAGDPVVVHGAKGAPKLQIWQGGEWTVSWAKWQAGSALS